MYGGRVIDEFDRRIVKTYMNEYMGDFLFDTFQPFHFFRDNTVDYTIPPDGNKDEYIRKEKIILRAIIETNFYFFIFKNLLKSYRCRTVLKYSDCILMPK